jgi:hypothetical protein
MITLMICKDNLPLTILKQEGFRNLMATAVPDYQLPNKFLRTNARHIHSTSL